MLYCYVILLCYIIMLYCYVILLCFHTSELPFAITYAKSHVKSGFIAAKMKLSVKSVAAEVISARNNAVNSGYQHFHLPDTWSARVEVSLLYCRKHGDCYGCMYTYMYIVLKSSLRNIHSVSFVSSIFQL